MVKKFSNFAEFVAEMHEFTKTSNERLLNFVNLASTLNQGCGCTRRARTEAASKEYLSIGEFLTEDNIDQVFSVLIDNGYTLEYEMTKLIKDNKLICLISK